MPFRNTPMRRKLMTMILLTSGAVLAVTCAAFFAYEFLTFRQATIRELSTLGKIIAANSTAALAFHNQDDADELLATLRAERHVVAACLYDKEGKLFSKYPSSLPVDAFPAMPAKEGYRFEHSHLAGFEPVVQGDNKQLGTLFLKSDLEAMYERFRLYGAITVSVIIGSFLIAYALSRVLQRQISQPILALAETAKAVSDRRDYSVRATRLGTDELGLLTDAFNHMLTQIEEQNVVLKEGEERVRAVLNSALSAVVVVDAWGKITDWNARAEKVFGWTRREALGQELAETIIPVRYREEHRRGLARFLETGEGPVLTRLIEMSALRRDGSEFPVELSVSPLKTGDAMTFCGFVTDITERKEAEIKLKAQLSRLNLLHRIVRAIGERQDLASIFQVIIRSLEDDLPIDFGCVCLYSPEEEVLTVTSVGVRSADLAMELALTEQARVAIDQNGLARCVRGNLVYEPDITQVPFPFPQRLARGGLCSFVAAPLLVESKVFGVLVAARRQANSFSSGECEFLRQLSEQVALAAHQAQLYGTLQQAYDDLRQSQQTVMQQERLRALGQMASGIAHDINNAISPVALYTESLLEREPNLSDRARDYLLTIQRAIDDVAHTVSGMREFYRQREPQLALTPVDLNLLVQQVIDLTRARWSDLAQRHGIAIKVQTELSPDLPSVVGAQGEIRDSLTNLVFNAVDAMPEGGTLTLKTGVISSPALQNEGEPAMQISLDVCDTGVGMDEGIQQRCLEPFFTTKGERGTGLGLAMVYGMVQRHSAKIEIQSELGKGTTVRLIFPVSVPCTTSSVRLAVPMRPKERLRLLLVDDDPLLIKSLRDTLEGDGHLITVADGGQAGIEAFVTAQKRGECFALVITDLGMPHVDGRKVAATVKAASPSTPIILLTGWGERLLAEHDVPIHVDRVLNKPPKLQQLRATLAELTASSVDARQL
jgi:PAS domain S-box-containing protein